MKKTTLISLALIFLSGCLPTLYPLYHGKDLIILPGLETTWIMKDDGKTYEWTFEVNPGAKEEDDFNQLTQSYMITVANRKLEERNRKNLKLITILAQDGKKDLRKVIMDQKRLGLIDYEDFEEQITPSR